MDDKKDHVGNFASAIVDGAKTGFLEEGRTWLRWAAAGAVLGGLLFGGAGFYFFGWIGLLYGLGIGAAVGAVGLWLFYLIASSF